MPKQKTHSGAKKRFKITGSGKLKKQQAGMRHNLEHKSSRRTRRLNQDQVLSKADTKTAKTLLGRSRARRTHRHTGKWQETSGR
ncbi:50S ribosomal protein L35 [Microbacterium sp. ISL-103]|nr:50S ribosomal protein L35 [Microbacterium sp. ISL-103]